MNSVANILQEPFRRNLAAELLRARGFINFSRDGVELRALQIAALRPGDLFRRRAAARAAWAGSGEAATEQVWFDLREKLGDQLPFYAGLLETCNDAQIRIEKAWERSYYTGVRKW